ncbi:MAG TPA: Hpt domain-containing protein [Bacteroidia bacterium]|jgi:HPt (histidine-containing phosphotransfer) domain-containing protein|nr:Hpt domain-containing protein [Bacteroidia bacterium]
MIKKEWNENTAPGAPLRENVCDLKYLNDMMGGKNHLIKGIIDAFLTQVPEELQAIDNAITKTNFVGIKSFAHTMKSSVSIMGITILAPILQEMENLAAKAIDMEKIKVLYSQLLIICKKAMAEIESEKHIYS